MKRIGLLILILTITSCTQQLPSVKDAVIIKEKEQTPALMDRIATYNEMVSNLNATAFIVYRDEEHTLSFRSGIMAYNHLESIRVDLSDFVFKTPLVTMVKNDNEIFAVNYIKKEYFITTIESVDFKRILGFEVPVELLFHSMLAKIYIPDQNYEAKQINDYSLEIDAQDHKQIITFNENLIPDNVQYTVQNDIYHVKFEKHDQQSSREFPLRVTLKNRNRVLEINYSDVDLDAELTEDLFRLEGAITDGFIQVD